MSIPTEPRWQCVACETIQAPAPSCRRCDKPFKGWRDRYDAQMVVIVQQPKAVLHADVPEETTAVACVYVVRPLADVVRETISAALEACGNVTAAARALGIARTTIYAQVWNGKLERPKTMHSKAGRPKKSSAKPESAAKL